jgi:hypothetical protein
VIETKSREKKVLTNAWAKRDTNCRDRVTAKVPFQTVCKARCSDTKRNCHCWQRAWGVEKLLADGQCSGSPSARAQSTRFGPDEYIYLIQSWRSAPRLLGRYISFQRGCSQNLLFALLQNDSYIYISMHKMMKQHRGGETGVTGVAGVDISASIVGMDDERFTRKVQYPTQMI